MKQLWPLLTSLYSGAFSPSLNLNSFSEIAYLLKLLAEMAFNKSVSVVIVVFFFAYIFHFTLEQFVILILLMLSGIDNIQCMVYFTLSTLV